MAVIIAFIIVWVVQQLLISMNQPKVVNYNTIKLNKETKHFVCSEVEKDNDFHHVKTLKNEILMTCQNYREDTRERLVMLLSQLSIHEDTSEFIDSNPFILKQIFSNDT